MSWLTTRRTVVHRDASTSRQPTRWRWIMLVVTRYRVGGGVGKVGTDAEFLGQARAALDVLSACAGFRSGRIGRAADDPSYWIMSTEWQHVGAYRRALSSYDVRVHAVPLLSLAVDEPTAYEVLASTGPDSSPDEATGRSDRASDAEAVGLGRASAPEVPSDLPG
jgi:hypothetical protein